MIDFILSSFKNLTGWKDWDMYRVFSILIGVISTITLIGFGVSLPKHELLWVYAIGFVVFFIITARIDPESVKDDSISESGVKTYLVVSSIFWTGHIFGLLVILYCAIGNVFVVAHNGLHNLKLTLPSMPKRKPKPVKTEPLPSVGAYRSPPATCETCGKIK